MEPKTKQVVLVTNILLCRDLINDLTNLTKISLTSLLKTQKSQNVTICVSLAS